MTVVDRPTLETNILIYSIDVSEGEKHERAKRLVDALLLRGATLPLQVLNELYFVCTRKKILPASAIESYNHSLLTCMEIIPPIAADLVAAMRLHQSDGQQFFDALLLTTAARAGCKTFFSEDLQHGRSFGSLQIVNPFALTAIEFEQLFA